MGVFLLYACRTIHRLHECTVFYFLLPKVIRKVLQENNLLPANKFPVGCVFLSLPSADIDVNVEPNKTAVFFKNAVSGGLSRKYPTQLACFANVYLYAMLPSL